MQGGNSGGGHRRCSQQNARNHRWGDEWLRTVAFVRHTLTGSPSLSNSSGSYPHYLTISSSQQQRNQVRSPRAAWYAPSTSSYLAAFVKTHSHLSLGKNKPHCPPFPAIDGIACHCTTKIYLKKRASMYTIIYTVGNVSATRTPPAPSIIDINFAVASIGFSWACTTHSAPHARSQKHHISATEPRISRAYVELMADLMISSESASCQGVRTAL